MVFFFLFKFVIKYCCWSWRTGDLFYRCACLSSAPHPHPHPPQLHSVVLARNCFGRTSLGSGKASPNSAPCATANPGNGPAPPSVDTGIPDPQEGQERVWLGCLLPFAQHSGNFFRDGECADAVAQRGPGAGGGVPSGARSPSALPGSHARWGLRAPGGAPAPGARRPRPRPSCPGHPCAAAAAQPESGTGGRRVPDPGPRVASSRSVPGSGTAWRGGLYSLSRGAARAAATAVPGSRHRDPSGERPAEGGAHGPRSPGTRGARETLGPGDGKLRSPTLLQTGDGEDPCFSPSLPRCLQHVLARAVCHSPVWA